MRVKAVDNGWDFNGSVVTPFAFANGRRLHRIEVVRTGKTINVRHGWSSRGM
jgi:hypothetical protein